MTTRSPLRAVIAERECVAFVLDVDEEIASATIAALEDKTIAGSELIWFQVDWKNIDCVFHRQVVDLRNRYLSLGLELLPHVFGPEEFISYSP
jgi:hypothetical protein